MSLLTLIRPELLAMNAYLPGDDNLVHRLHANESPESPIQREQFNLNCYPDAREQQALEETLAARYQVNSEQLVLTRGSDEAIDLLMRLFLRPGIDSIMQCPPTFPMYAFYAQLQQAAIINCPLNNEDFSLSPEQLNLQWQANCKLIMLCQPNNPTGNLLSLEAIAQICRQFSDKAMIVVDEAYIEFAEIASATSLLSTFENLIVLRTLSKAYGLAGLRLGSLIAQPQIIKVLKKVIAPYTLSTAVIKLGQQALANTAWLDRNIQNLLQERETLMEQFQQSPWISKIYPSHSNFIFLESPYARDLAAWFAQNSIAIRHFHGSLLLENKLRITVGSAVQNQLLLKTLTSFNPEGTKDAKSFIY